MSAKRRIPLAAYERTSRRGARRGESFISFDQQHQPIESYVRTMSARSGDDFFIAEVFRDDFSGATMRRPEWDRLMAEVDVGNFAGVVVMQTDRFARTMAEGAMEVQDLLRRKTQWGPFVFASAVEGYDPRTPEGELMMNQFLAWARFQHARLSRGWKSSKAAAIERGAHIGRVPLGYSQVPKGETLTLRRGPKEFRRRASGQLYADPDPYWRRAIGALFELAAEHRDWGDGAIAAELNRKHPRPHGQLWTASTVGNIRKNRVFLGEVSYRYACDEHSGRSKRRKHGCPECEAAPALVYPRAHEPLVDEQTFAAAQREPKRARKKRVQSPRRRPENILLGIARCAGCRYQLRGGSADGKRRYGCGAKHGGGKCPSPAYVFAETLENYVIAVVETQAADRVRFRGSAGPASADPGEAEALEAELKSARLRLHEHMTDLDARKAMEAAGMGETWVEARDRHLAEIQRLAREHNDAAAVEVPDTKLLARYRHIRQLDFEEQHEALKYFVDAVYLRAGRNLAIEDRVLVVWRGELEDDVPHKGNTRGPKQPISGVRWW